MKHARLIIIALVTVLAGLGFYTYKIHNVRGTVKQVEILRSCETGFLFYVLKYEKSYIHPLEKQRRIRYINYHCRRLAGIYLEMKNGRTLRRPKI